MSLNKIESIGISKHSSNNLGSQSKKLLPSDHNEKVAEVWNRTLQIKLNGMPNQNECESRSKNIIHQGDIAEIDRRSDSFFSATSNQHQTSHYKSFPDMLLPLSVNPYLASFDESDIDQIEFVKADQLGKSHDEISRSHRQSKNFR